jgi:Amylo-alpha-1,6-glucosidase
MDYDRCRRITPITKVVMVAINGSATEPITKARPGGPFVQAHLRAYQNPALARQFLQPMANQLYAHGLGSLSEIFDGNAPIAPRGCIAQAWMETQ